MFLEGNESKMKDTTMPNPYAPKRLYATSKKDETPVLTPDPVTEEDVVTVPDGTAKIILEWVGSDKERAVLAIEAENAREKPRSTLLANLADIIGEDND